MLRSRHHFCVICDANNLLKTVVANYVRVPTTHAVHRVSRLRNKKRRRAKVAAMSQMYSESKKKEEKKEEMKEQEEKKKKEEEPLNQRNRRSALFEQTLYPPNKLPVRVDAVAGQIAIIEAINNSLR